MIDLYSWSTPNGWKVSAALEELELPYKVHEININTGIQKGPEFLKINPNGRIPAIIDRDADDLTIFESGAILIYLAEKTGRLMPTDLKGRYEVMQWLMFQMGGIGPMLGQMGFFVKFAGSEIEDPRPRERYVNEARRLLAVVEKQLEGQDWIAGDFFSIADIAIAPWIKAIHFYEAAELVGLADLPNVTAYVDRFMARPAVQKASNIPDRNG